MPDTSHALTRPDRMASGFMIGAGVGLLAYAVKRRAPVGLLALGSVPLLYRGLSGRWPGLARPDGDTRRALSGSGGVNVRESVRVELPLEDVYAFWRRLENLPRFMTGVESVHEDGDTSHWVARGPRDMRVTWDAELINDVPNKLVAWRSLPGSDITSAGSVNFDRVRGGSTTQVTLRMQYALPAGKAGNVAAMLFRSAPSQTIREDLRRLKQLLEAGELAQATSSQWEGAR